MYLGSRVSPTLAHQPERFRLTRRHMALVVHCAVSRPLQDILKKIVLSSVFYDETQKLARKELVQRKKLEMAVPRPLSSRYRYVVTTQLKLEIAVPRPLSSTYDYLTPTRARSATWRCSCTAR